MIPGVYFFVPADLFFESSFLAWSPMIDLAGQTENIGHFLQPTAMATGQSVMVFPLCG